MRISVKKQDARISAGKKVSFAEIFSRTGVIFTPLVEIGYAEFLHGQNRFLGKKEELPKEEHHFKQILRTEVPKPPPAC